MDNIEPQPTPIISETPLKPIDSLPKPKNNRILLAIIAILFVALLYSLFLNFNKTPTSSITQETSIIPTAIPTSNPTADWKTYTNNKYGFSFQYDNTKHLLENISVDQNNISSYSQYYNLDLRPEGLVLWKGLKTEAIPEESITMHFNPAVLFSIEIFNNSISPEEFVKKMCESEYGPDYLKASGFKKINSNGQTFYYFNSGGIGQGTFQYVFFNDNNIVSFNTSELSNTYETNPEFAQILSTFKFTENQAIIGWKKASLQHYITNDDCISVSIDDPKSITTTLDKFVRDYSSTWSKEPYPLYQTQFVSNKYQTKTLSAMNMEEISNTFLLAGKIVYKITAMVNKPVGPPVCKSNYDDEIGDLIGNLSF